MRSVLLLTLLLAGCVMPPGPTSPDDPLGEAQEMVYEPTQCRTNPWQASDPGTAERSDAEARRIVEHYAGQGVTLQDMRFVDRHEAVCEACHCPRGDWIHAHVPAADAGRARDLGWEYLSHASTPASG